MKPVYRFFVQPQIDVQTQSVFGYELLIKQLTPKGWRLPESFTKLDTQEIAKLLIATTKILGLKVQYCSVNISREQLMDTKMEQAIIKSQMQLYPTKLVVELTEEKGPKKYSNLSLIPHLRNFMEHGMQVSLDDVGTGDNSLESVRDLLPLASEMKFALQNFRTGIKDPNIREKLRNWQDVSQKYGLRLILEGIEDQEDADMCDSLQINLRQGYFYGKPALLPLSGDKATN